jgi:hypothetical protein
VALARVGKLGGMEILTLARVLSFPVMSPPLTLWSGFLALVCYGHGPTQVAIAIAVYLNENIETTRAALALYIAVSAFTMGVVLCGCEPWDVTALYAATTGSGLRSSMMSSFVSIAVGGLSIYTNARIVRDPTEQQKTLRPLYIASLVLSIVIPLFHSCCTYQRSVIVADHTTGQPTQPRSHRAKEKKKRASSTELQPLTASSSP